MEIKPVEEIIKEIKSRYDKDPNNWLILRGKDDNISHIDTFIKQNETLWQMKSELKNPYQHIGVGARFGRKIDAEIDNVMKTGKKIPFGEIYPQPDKNFIIASGMESYSSKSVNTLKETLSSSQKKLDEKLNKSLKNLLYREGFYNGYE